MCFRGSSLFCRIIHAPRTFLKDIQPLAALRRGVESSWSNLQLLEGQTSRNSPIDQYFLCFYHYFPLPSFFVRKFIEAKRIPSDLIERGCALLKMFRYENLTMKLKKRNIRKGEEAKGEWKYWFSSTAITSSGNLVGRQNTNWRFCESLSQ